MKYACLLSAIILESALSLCAPKRNHDDIDMKDSEYEASVQKKSLITIKRNYSVPAFTQVRDPHHIFQKKIQCFSTPPISNSRDEWSNNSSFKNQLTSEQLCKAFENTYNMLSAQKSLENDDDDQDDAPMRDDTHDDNDTHNKLYDADLDEHDIIFLSVALDLENKD